MPGYVELLATRLAAALAAATDAEHTHVLFTAHSLPARILETGDPYPDQLREPRPRRSPTGPGSTTTLVAGVAERGADAGPVARARPARGARRSSRDQGVTRRARLPAAASSPTTSRVLYDLDIEAKRARRRARPRVRPHGHRPTTTPRSARRSPAWSETTWVPLPERPRRRSRSSAAASPGWRPRGYLRHGTALDVTVLEAATGSAARSAPSELAGVARRGRARHVPGARAVGRRPVPGARPRRRPCRARDGQGATSGPAAALRPLPGARARRADRLGPAGALAASSRPLAWPAPRSTCAALRQRTGADPSSPRWSARRFGPEVVDRLVDPLLGGINAGRATG